MNQFLILLLGVFLGWITKVPFLLKLYKEKKRIEESCRNYAAYADRVLDEAKKINVKP